MSVTADVDDPLLAQLAVLKPVLIQECLAHDPWRLLIAVTLLNKTSAKLAIPVLWNVLDKWPDPWALSQADQAELTSILHSLGTQNIRSRRLISISRAYLQDPPFLPDLRPSYPRWHSPVKRRRYPATPISHLPGTGPYALDSYRIFCTTYHNPLSEEWKYVEPSDKELVRYLILLHETWKWAFVERKEWTSSTGVVRPVTVNFLEHLVSELKVTEG